MDVLLGGNSATADQSIANFLSVESTFSFSYCNKYLMYDHVALFALGAAFRVLAFLLLRFGKKSQY